MKLLFMTNIPSPYRVGFFNQLGKYCDLTVTFEKRTSEERDKSWENYQFENFKGIFLKGKSINTDTAICFDVLKYVKDRSFDKIICANFCSPTGMIAIQYMKNHYIPYWLESDGGFAKDGKGIKEKLKKHFIKGADGYLSTGKLHDEYYLTYGAKAEHIVRYPFTSLHEKDILSAPLNKEEKQRIRDRLAIKEKKVVVAVGQFIYRKGFDILIRAAEKIDKEIGIYIIGGEPTKEYIDLRNSFNAKNVHFEGFKNKEKLAEYYQASDLFVLPTREDIWGLVINEAMAYGLPIIATDRCVAGLELVENGENGYIVKVGDEISLAERIKQILDNPQTAARMGECSIRKIQNYTIEKMVMIHMNYLNQGE